MSYYSKLYPAVNKFLYTKTLDGVCKILYKSILIQLIAMKFIVTAYNYAIYYIFFEAIFVIYQNNISLLHLQ